MKSIDIKIEQARKRAEAEKAGRRPMTNPPKDGLTDIVKTPRFDPAKPKVTTPPPENDGEWEICCTAVGWMVNQLKRKS